MSLESHYVTHDVTGSACMHVTHVPILAWTDRDPWLPRTLTPLCFAFVRTVISWSEVPQRVADPIANAMTRYHGFSREASSGAIGGQFGIPCAELSTRRYDRVPQGMSNDLITDLVTGRVRRLMSLRGHILRLRGSQR